MDRAPMSKAGFESLKRELHRLKTVERPKNVKEIEEARAHGDISENAEFHAAKERQSQLEAQMGGLEDKIARAQVIDPTGQDLEAVRFGHTVDLIDINTDEKVSYTILGEEESDVSNGCISVSSPVARALLGKGEGDAVPGRIPKGTRQFEVVKIRQG